MSSFPHTDRLDRDEFFERQPRVEYPDPLNMVIGSDIYTRHHRLDEVVRGLAGMPYRLVASRFYFLAEPRRVWVDYKAETGADFLIEAKREYCEREGIRYVIIENALDIAPFLPDPSLQPPEPKRSRRPGKVLRPPRRSE